MLEIYYGVLRMSGNQKTVVLPSNHSSSFTSPIYARKDPSSPTKFLPLNLSSRPLETLGRSLTTMPHFGKYIGLQFTDHSRLRGIETLHYYLEWNRVAAVPSGERNFHIFYYLVVGASPEKRQHLHLQEEV